MENELTVEDLLSALDEQSSLTEEDLLAALEDPFLDEGGDSEEEEDSGDDVYTTEDYYDTPGGTNPVSTISQRTGITAVDPEHPVYRQLMTDSSFRDADPSEKRRVFFDAVDSANTELYNQRGEKSDTAAAFGLDMRTQKVTNEDGEPQTYVVPGPSSRSSGRAGRIVAGGVSEAAKGIARVGEGITDAIGAGADALGVNEALEDTGLRIGTDPDTDYVKENFPTVPPEDVGDEVGQEIVSILVGSIGGAGLATKLETALNLTPKAASFMAKQWSKIGKKSPEELYDAARIFSKTLVVGTGANIGATATTPETTEPLFGDDIVEALGFDAEENRNLANFADNVTFSAGLTLLGRTIKGGGKVASKLVPLKILQKSTRDRELGALLLKEIDPNMDGIPAEVFAERARIMGEVLQNNKTFRAELLANTEINLDSTTAIYQGSEEYVRRAYGWQEALLGAEKYEKFVKDAATNIRSKMTDIRQGRVTAGSIDVRNADKGIVEGFDSAMTNTIEEVGGQDAVISSAETLSKPIVEEVGSARQELDLAMDTLVAADTALDEAANQNVVMETLQEARTKNVLGSDETERALLENLTGDQLYKAWSDKRSAYKTAFKTLPDVPVAMEEIINIVEEAGARTNDFNTISTTSTKEDPLASLLRVVRPKVANGVAETTEEVVARLEAGGNSFKDMFTGIRPKLALRIKNLLDSNQDASALIALKFSIDEIARGADPAYGNALDLYEDYAGTFLATDALVKFSEAAKEVNPRLKTASGDPKGLANAYQAGMNAFNQSIGPNAVTKNTDAFIAALDSGAQGIDTNPELAKAFVGHTLNMLNKGLDGGAGVNSTGLTNAIAPYLKVLERTDQDLVTLFKGAVEELRAAESGLGDAKKAKADAHRVYLDILKSAKLDTASKFVENINATPSAKTNPQAVFDNIFNSNEAPAQIADLMKAAEQSGDPLVKSGIQAQYLTWLQNSLKTGRRFGGDTEGTARELSAAKLDKILRDPSSPVLRSLDIVFADNPDRAAQIVALLDVQDLALTGRQGRGATFGSNTAYDQQIQKFVNRINVVLFGVLNPTATVARNVSQAVTENYRKGIQADVLKTLDLMIADPDEFDRVMKLVEIDEIEEALDIMSKHLGKGVYSAALPLEDQMEETLPE
jgi:hypothetical protein